MVLYFTYYLNASGIVMIEKSRKLKSRSVDFLFIYENLLGVLRKIYFFKSKFVYYRPQ